MLTMPQEELFHHNCYTIRTDNRLIVHLEMFLDESDASKYNFAMYEELVLLDIYSFCSIPLSQHCTNQ